VLPDDAQHPRQFPDAGGRGTFASDINNAGTVVGYSNNLDQNPRAFLSSPGSTQRLGALPGDVNSRAVAISNSGAVAGDSAPIVGAPGYALNYRAFIWTPQSGMTDLGTPAGMVSTVNAISDQDWIVGAWGQGSTSKPFLWRPGLGMADLSFLLDLSGTDFTSMGAAMDINARGDILASVLDANGRSHIVIFSLVPEPADWLFAVCGLLLLVRRRVCRLLHGNASADPSATICDASAV
jgi:probable HAF family extracellular repeat protein